MVCCLLIFIYFLLYDDRAIKYIFIPDLNKMLIFTISYFQGSRTSTRHFLEEASKNEKSKHLEKKH